MPLSEEQKSYADLAEASGYLPTYRSILQEMCASFWWHAVDHTGSSHILHNGTICFVDTGTRILGVTAAHVFRQYIIDKEENNSVVCQLGSITFNPEDHLIDIDDKIDLATIGLSSVVVAGSDSAPIKYKHWPPSVVEPGQVLLLGGHPGVLRREELHVAELPFQWFLTSMVARNDKISLCLELEDCHVPVTRERLGNYELGGMSGGPVFRYIPPCPIERIELTGFIYEFQQSFGLLFARPASCINADGTINRTYT